MSCQTEALTEKFDSAEHNRITHEIVRKSSTAPTHRHVSRVTSLPHGSEYCEPKPSVLEAVPSTSTVSVMKANKISFSLGEICEANFQSKVHRCVRRTRGEEMKTCHVQPFAPGSGKF